MKLAKILVLCAGGALLFIIAGLLAVWLLVNPNHYKARIAAAVRQATGRELVLTGDIKLSVFPVIALELGPASLGNPPGFGDQPFLSFREAAVRVKLLPLLQERLEIAGVQVDGLELRLFKNAQGVGNWQEPRHGVATASQAQSGGGSSLSLASFANVHITHGSIGYLYWRFNNVELETGSMTSEGVIPFNLSLDANRGVAGEALSVSAKFDLGEHSAARLELASGNLSGTLAHPGDARPVHWELMLPALEVDFDQQTLALPTFSLSYSAARIDGSVRAARIFDQPRAEGSVTLAPAVLREVAPRIGIPLPRTQDPKALSQLSGSADFAYDAQGVSLSKVAVRLDDTQLTGWLKRTSGTNATVQFELAADKIDLNRYRGADDAAPVATRGTREAGPGGALGLEADGTFSVGALHVAKLDLTNLQVTLAAHGGLTHVYPLTAQLYGGRYSGNITYDRRAAIPVLGLDEHLSGVDMAKMLTGTAQQGRLSGRASINLKANARGADSAAVLRSLSGQMDANLADGAVEGVDLSYELDRAQALINQRASTAANTRRTRFDTFKMSAIITDGVAVTNDLTIDSQVLRIAGQGSANLSNKVLNFKTLASVLKEQNTHVVDIPLNITGTYTDPIVRPDLGGLAKDQLKQKLQDVLKKNGLQDLFK